MSHLLFIAARTGDAPALHRLLTDHSDDLIRDEVDDAGRTAIFYAQLGGHVDAVTLLSQHGWTPMDKSNMFEGPGGRLCFWSEPKGVRVRQLRQHAPLVNWDAPQPRVPWSMVHSVASGDTEGRPFPAHVSRKKETVAFRKRQRQARYRSVQNSFVALGMDHPMYPRKAEHSSKRRRARGAALPTLRRIKDELDDYDTVETNMDEELDEEDEVEAEDAVQGSSEGPVPVSRSGLSGVMAATTMPDDEAPMHGEGGDAEWVLVPVMRRYSSSSSSFLEVEREDSPPAVVSLPAFDGEQRMRSQSAVICDQT